ncbi:MAG: hypothetical protein IPG10_07240 [Flavobacteriales bacterium]|jgi:hypothetical protein|nr:hypothetical protein [Flavobacteriales bacterium]
MDDRSHSLTRHHQAGPEHNTSIRPIDHGIKRIMPSTEDIRWMPTDRPEQRNGPARWDRIAT